MTKIKIGNFLTKDERQYKISDIEGHEVILEDTVTDVHIRLKSSEISDLILLGKAKIISSNTEVERISGDMSPDFSSYDEKLKEKARYKWKFVSRVLEVGLTAFSPGTLTPLINDVSEEYGVKSVNWRTLVRWLEKYQVNGIRGLIPQNSLKGNRDSRGCDDTDRFLFEGLESLKNSKKVSFRTAYRYFKDAILLENATRQINEYLPIVSYQSFIKRANKLAPYDLMVSQLGKRKADVLFRESRYTQKIKYILDRAEIDHTVLDFFVVDEITRLPLGRPYITAIIDRKSRCVLGSYIGFEPPSFVSVAKAIKNAISDKSELVARYPEVQHDWPCKGVFSSIAYDQGKEFISNLLKDALLDLDIMGVGNPVKMPWYKGAIESHFKSINQRMLNDKPGKVFSNIMDSNDYNPEKNAVISLHKLVEIYYVWLIDIYHRSPVGEDKIIPYLAWQEDLPYVDITPINPERLDIVFSENLKRENGPKGIRYSKLLYDSNELVKMRKYRKLGRISIKINREDLSYIHVLHPDTGLYYKVPAVDQEYTEGLSLHQHNIIKRFRDKWVDDNVDELSLAQARKRIEEIIDKEILYHKKTKVAASKRIARYRGVEQHMEGEASIMRPATPDASVTTPSPKGIPKDDYSKPESNSDFLAKFNKNSEEDE
ncbi:MAG: putative transposase [Psychromonas sp.]|jgi:putative transposase